MSSVTKFKGKPFSRAVLMVAVGVFTVNAEKPARATIYTPTAMRNAYGFNNLTFGSTGVSITGAGQTIAIIDWDNDPNIVSETAKFNSTFGLPAFGSGGPTLTVVGQTGGAVPTTTTTSIETALDVQWAHAIAPQANILLVEPNSANFSDTNAAINYAKAYPGVSSLSMSYGATDSLGTGVSYSSVDSPFQSQAAGHTGVTFFASTGDTSTPSYPATSQHVVAVGGTNLTIKADGTRNTETVWRNSTSSAEGAGYSNWDPRPTFQNSVSTNAKRGIPDLVMDADPNSGVYVYYGAGANPTQYSGIGGTSLAAPMMAAVMALANQGRVLNGLTPLTSDQTLAMLYALVGTPEYSNCFYDVTSGTISYTSGGTSYSYSAGVGFDVPSGLGAPKPGLIQYLAGFNSVPEPTCLGLLMTGGLFVTRRRRTK